MNGGTVMINVLIIALFVIMCVVCNVCPEKCGFLKNRKVILCVFLGIAGVIFLYEFYPVKFSVKKENISGKEYILASPYDITTTMANWKITGDEHGLVNIPYYVSMQGNKPQGFNFEIYTAENIFVCYGYFMEDEEFEGESYKVFYAQDWDILYPVKRNSMFSSIMPKAFIANIDMERATYNREKQ